MGPISYQPSMTLPLTNSPQIVCQMTSASQIPNVILQKKHLSISKLTENDMESFWQILKPSPWWYIEMERVIYITLANYKGRITFPNLIFANFENLIMLLSFHRCLSDTCLWVLEVGLTRLPTCSMSSHWVRIKR